jgi:hypothetical protein
VEKLDELLVKNLYIACLLVRLETVIDVCQNVVKSVNLLLRLFSLLPQQFLQILLFFLAFLEEKNRLLLSF